ncbi:uncharacterized protein IWZ02DRAFT_189262 [Phyllosticta citriasiana]|uniref:uncharacterized protein n=1 Tax=Phyllosticta citriasiana TaxID=595635 RepID=UPI0030FDED73
MLIGNVHRFQSLLLVWMFAFSIPECCDHLRARYLFSHLACTTSFPAAARTSTCWSPASFRFHQKVASPFVLKYIRRQIKQSSSPLTARNADPSNQPVLNLLFSEPSKQPIRPATQHRN